MVYNDAIYICDVFLDSPIDQGIKWENRGLTAKIVAIVTIQENNLITIKWIVLRLSKVEIIWVRIISGIKCKQYSRREFLPMYDNRLFWMILHNRIIMVIPHKDEIINKK